MKMENRVAWSRFSPRLGEKLRIVLGQGAEQYEIVLGNLGENGTIAKLPKEIQNTAKELKNQLITDGNTWATNIL